MADVNTLLVMFSVLVLVVVEISGRAQNVDLLYHSRMNPKVPIFLDLGYFSLIHIVNVFLLVMGLFTIAIELLVTDSLPLYFSGIIGLIILLILPLLEVDSPDFFNKPELSMWYIFYVIFTIAYLGLVMYVSFIQLASLKYYPANWLSLIFVILLFLYLIVSIRTFRISIIRTN